MTKLNTKIWCQKLLPVSMAGCLALSLAACGNSAGNANKGSMYKNDVRPNNINRAYLDPSLGPNMQGMNGRNNPRWNQASSLHQNTRMDSNQAMAAKIASLSGVDSAYVITTDNNAYAAIVMDRMNGDIQGSGNTTTNGFDNRFTNPNRNGTSFNSDPIRGTGGANSAQGSLNRSGMSSNTPTGRDTGGGSMSGASTGVRAQQINGMGSNSSTINSNDVPIALKAQVAMIIRSIDPSIQNVFVSANPQFIKSLGDFVRTASAGHPIKGLVNEFNMMVERVFPTNAANLTDGNRDGAGTTDGTIGRTTGGSTGGTTGNGLSGASRMTR